eukprot:jgi/Hompol1/2391/HPOL_002924-RA
MRIIWRHSVLRAAMQCCQRCIDIAIVGLGPILVVAALSIVSIKAFLFFWVVLPDCFPPLSEMDMQLGKRQTLASKLGYMLNAAFASYLIVCIVFHYAMAVLTDPGRTHAALIEELVGNLPTELAFEDVVSNKPLSAALQSTPICQKCTMPKPPRAHHCSVCRRCIMKMDHHCPWIANCVGLFNHRYFFLFLVYATIGIIYFAFMSLSIAFRVFTSATLTMPAIVETLFIFAFLLSAAISPVLGGFTAWNAYLIGSGQTTLETIINQQAQQDYRAAGQHFINDYDLGTWQNFREFFNLSPSSSDPMALQASQ